MSESTTTTTSPAAETTTETAPVVELATDETPAEVEPPATQEDDSAPTDDATEGREAAKYRRKLRAAETELETVRAQVDALRRTEIGRVLKDERRPIKPEAIFAAGIDMQEMLTEDGAIEPAAVLAAVDKAAAVLGIPARLPVAPPANDQGNVGSALPTSSTASWGDVLRG